MKEDPRLHHDRIVADPHILAGKPVIKGTRIAVDLVLEELSHNPDITELLAVHPDLTRDDVQACLAYAQALVTGEEVSPKPPKGARSDSTRAPARWLRSQMCFLDMGIPSCNSPRALSIMPPPSCDVPLLQGSPAHSCPGPWRLGLLFSFESERSHGRTVPHHPV